MDISAVASASISYSMAKTEQAVSIALLKDTMDTQSQQADAIIRQMDQLTASFGHSLDILV